MHNIIAHVHAFWESWLENDSLLTLYLFYCFMLCVVLQTSGKANQTTLSNQVKMWFSFADLTVSMLIKILPKYFDCGAWLPTSKNIQSIFITAWLIISTHFIYYYTMALWFNDFSFRKHPVGPQTSRILLSRMLLCYIL